jgi:CubicO group peptidase (beta-lactamase class C family)
MTTTVRIICFTLLLSAFSFRAVAKDSTNTSADYLLKTTNESRGNSESVGKVQDFLFLPPTTMPATYRHMADFFATRIIKRGHAVYPLPRAEKPLAVTYQAKGKTATTDEFMSRNDVTGLLLIKDGKIVLERYGSGNTEKTKWPSWSIAKSVTSTLVGAALKDGYIASIDDPVIKYLPQLKGSAYEGTTIKNLLQMSSGIKFNENYEDRNSDFSRLMECYYDRAGASCVLSLAKAVSRRVPPGTKFQYATLNTTVVGLVVMAATHKTLAGYLSEKIWSPFGMEEDAMWVLDSNGGQEFGGALIGATLRDYGRFGEFILNGGTAGGKQVVPENWVDEATHPRPDTPQVNYGKLAPSGDPVGYGYSWWLYAPQQPSPNEEEAFIAEGIFGQHLYINPKEKFVGVFWGAWPKPWDDEKALETEHFLDAAIRASR